MSRPTAGLIALALAIAAACEAGRPPVRSGSAGTASGGTTGVVASSAPKPEVQVSNAARVGCNAIAEVLRSVAKAVGDRSSTITSSRDTTDTLSYGPEVGCVVTWRDSGDHVLPVRDVFARLERSEWHPRPHLVDASGPGSEALAFSRGSAACVVSGESDAGDDADSTHVPAPGFTITATCFRDRPDPR